MKNLILTIFAILIIPSISFAENVTCDMGGMDVDSYGLYIGFLGLLCGLCFVLGINSGLHR